MTEITDAKSLKEIGNRLREIREKQGLSQDEASKACKISVTYFAEIERGERNLSVTTVKSICKGLKIKSSQLLPF